MLNTTSFDPLSGFQLDGTQTQVNLGWLQTPPEFARDCLALTQRPQFEAWALSTQLSDETVRILQSPLVPSDAVLALATSKEGIVYPVVTLQSAGLQVRLLLSLATPATHEWLRAVASEGIIRIAVQIPEADQVAVITMPCNLRPGSEVENIIRSCAMVDREAFVLDAAKAAHHFAGLGAIPSLIPGFQTQDLRLVLVLEAGPDYDAATPDAKKRVLN